MAWVGKGTILAMASNASQKSSFSSWLAGRLGVDRVEAEKSRLEAFLNAFPGEYCGFNPDGSVAYSQGFLTLLDVPTVRSIADVQNALNPGDAAALESYFARLRQNGSRFSFKAKSQDGIKIFMISGSPGQDLRNTDRFDILWVEDITEQEDQSARERKVVMEKQQEVERIKSILDVVPWPVWMRDAGKDLAWVNARYAETLNLPREQVLQEQKDLSFKAAVKKGGTALSPRDMAQAALASGEPQKEHRHMISQGERRFVEIVEYPLKHLNVTVGVVRDMTREEELENVAQRNMAANRELLEQLRSAIGIFSADQKLEFYNSAFSQLWQVEDSWLNSKPKLGEILEKLRETRRLPEQSDFRNYKQGWLDMFTNLIRPHEDMMYLPNGTALRMLVVPHPMGGLMMTFEDVTSRLALESSYNTLIAVQKETLDNLAEGVAAFGGDGRLKLWNPSFARMWHLNPEDLGDDVHITKVVDKMKPFFEEEMWARQKDDLLSQGLERVMRDGIIIRADDSIIEFAAVPLPDGGMLLTHIDITDTVRVENALREKTAALETAERLKLDFLANVSYQLRTPLNAIVGFTEILDKQFFGPLNERQREYTKGLGEAGERLMNLINDILDLSTIDAGYMSLEQADVDIYSLLQGIFDLTQEWARGEKIEVKLDCSKKIGAMYVDERRIKQVLLNLIRNAIAYTPAGGNIILSAKTEGEDVIITVHDTGPGIPPEDQERIFRPFERSDVARLEDNMDTGPRTGAGLGLSLVKNIVELHGGFVTLESAPGEGTSVILTLPIKA